MKRIRKAFGSVGSKKKTMKALRILETYKTTLHMYSISSARPTPSTANIQSFRYIPARKFSYFVGREEIFRQPARHLEDTTVTKSDRRTVVLIGKGVKGKHRLPSSIAEDLKHQAHSGSYSG
jgi:hypothetical protein